MGYWGYLQKKQTANWPPLFGHFAAVDQLNQMVSMNTADTTLWVVTGYTPTGSAIVFMSRFWFFSTTRY